MTSLLFQRRLRRLLVLAGLPVIALGAMAQGQGQSPGQNHYPDKPVRFVVPYPPGGGTDVIARIVQGKFEKVLGQSIVIDNRGGGGGSTGTAVAAQGAPDGYTVLFTLSSHTINPAIYPKLPFNTERDFEPVGMVASLPQILVANKGFAPNTVADMVQHAKSQPQGSVQFASVGNGSPGHLAGELLNLRTGSRIVHVPYRGGGPAINDVLGGQVPTLWVSIPAAAQFVKNGQLKAFAVSTTKRSAAFPDVPTMQESGIADFDVDSWYAMFVPARTPKAIVEKLNAALNQVLADPEIKARLLEQGSEAVGGTPEKLAQVVAAEIPKWTSLVKQANLKID
jgi:tripartite-type tricarboxylate transporter receptor subunit TctC